jgi:hypothetical protein
VNFKYPGNILEKATAYVQQVKEKTNNDILWKSGHQNGLHLGHSSF